MFSFAFFFCRSRDFCCDFEISKVGSVMRRKKGVGFKKKFRKKSKKKFRRGGPPADHRVGISPTTPPLLTAVVASRREKRASLSYFLFCFMFRERFLCVYECFTLFFCLYTSVSSCMCTSLVLRRTLRSRPLDRRSNGRWCSYLSIYICFVFFPCVYLFEPSDRKSDGPCFCLC